MADKMEEARIAADVIEKLSSALPHLSNVFFETKEEKHEITQQVAKKIKEYLQKL